MCTKPQSRCVECGKTNNAVVIGGMKDLGVGMKGIVL